MLDKVGDYFGLFTHHFLRHLYSVRGDIPRELAQAETEIAIGTERGDMEAFRVGPLWEGGRTGAGRLRVDEAAELATRAIRSVITRGSITEILAEGTLGFVRLQASDYRGARVCFERSRKTIQQKAFFFEFVGPIYPLLVESLLGPRWADTATGPGHRKEGPA